MNANRISEFDVINSLSKKLGQKDAKLLIAFVNEKANLTEEHLANKEDLANVKVDIIDKLHTSQKSILTTVVLLIIGQLGVLLSIILIFLK
jgi:hypothetical protein